MKKLILACALLAVTGAANAATPLPPAGCKYSHDCRAAWLARYCHETIGHGLQCPGAPKGWRYRLWLYET